MSKTTITGIKTNKRLSLEPLIDRLTKLSITYDPLSSRVNLDGFKQDLSKEEFKRQLTKVTDDCDHDLTIMMMMLMMMMMMTVMAMM